MNFKSLKYYFFPILISFVFFAHGLITLVDYGLNWDAPFHYQRGQMMLRLFTTGKTNYDGVPECKYLQGAYYEKRSDILEKCPSQFDILKSRYADPQYDLKYVREIEDQGGHPPLGGFGGAITNVIFYGYLGLFSDGDSYQIFPLIAVLLLYLALGIWATQLYGRVAGIVTVLVIGLYPLLLGERQFNFKDPLTAAYYVLSIYLFWLAVTRKNLKYFILSSIVFALSIYTKFNAIFVPFITFPWLLYYIFEIKLNKKKQLKSLRIAVSEQGKKYMHKKFVILLGLYFIFPILFLFAFWPRLWVDPLVKFYETIIYYKEIGSGIRYQADSEFFLGFSLSPLKYILYTTPISILILTLVGLIGAILHIFKDKTKTLLLWVLLFLVPILRVVLPGMSSYGGIRQIMEFSGGMALLSGFGAYLIIRFLKTNFKSIPSFVYIVCVFIYFLPTILILNRLHPNENLYFNELIGGNIGAKNKNFEGWDQHFGNVYYQGIDWINKNAEPNAKLAYSIIGTENNVSFGKLRKDINSSGANWSGHNKQGEYIIQTNLSGIQMQRYSVAWELKSLIPVHVLKVGGAELGYVFKNTWEFTKPEFRKQEKIIASQINKDEAGIIINLPDNSVLTRLTYSYDKSCKEKPNGWIYLSQNNNEVKMRESLAEQYYTLPAFEMGGNYKISNYYFPYEKASSIRIKLDPEIAIDPDCPLTISNITVYGIE